MTPVEVQTRNPPMRRRPAKDDKRMSRQIIESVDGFPETALRQMKEIVAESDGTVCFLPEVDGRRSAPPEVEAPFSIPPLNLVEQSGLSFLQLHSSGSDASHTPALVQRKRFPLANARSVTAQAVAEHCMSMMFTFARCTPFHAINQQGSVWQRASRYELLHGSTVTIVGTGATGSALGMLDKGIGMRVLAVQRRADMPRYADAVYTFHDLATALQKSRHLALAMPALPGERPLIGAREFDYLPRGSFVYNVGRPSILDCPALSSALDSGRLAGVGLDVFPKEPLPSTDNLWKRSDVIVSPHAGGRFIGEMDVLADLFVDNLRRYLNGAPLRNLVPGIGLAE